MGQRGIAQTQQHASSSAAVGGKNSETFSFALALVVPVSELEAWFETAAPLAKAIYATGFELPREEAAVALVRQWVDAGEVRTFQRRDPMDQRRWQFLIERVDTASARARQVMPDLTASQLLILHRVLVEAAAAGAPCPSRAKLAEAVTGQTHDKARERARWLMKRLEAEGKIAIQPAPFGAQHGPKVTILTGRHAGKSTGSDNVGSNR
jgi:hypothetical protein